MASPETNGPTAMRAMVVTKPPSLSTWVEAPSP
jgi:hypothetical protein